MYRTPLEMYFMMSSCEVVGFHPDVEDDNVDPQKEPRLSTGDRKNWIRVKTSCKGDLNLELRKRNLKTSIHEIFSLAMLAFFCTCRLSLRNLRDEASPFQSVLTTQQKAHTLQ